MFLEFVRNISFIEVVFAFEDLKMPVTLCFEKISAPRCFMSKVCQFGELVHLCKNINTHFMHSYWQLQCVSDLITVQKKSFQVKKKIFFLLCFWHLTPYQIKFAKLTFSHQIHFSCSNHSPVFTVEFARSSFF